MFLSYFSPLYFQQSIDKTVIDQLSCHSTLREEIPPDLSSKKAKSITFSLERNVHSIFVVVVYLFCSFFTVSSKFRKSKRETNTIIFFYQLFSVILSLIIISWECRSILQKKCYKRIQWNTIQNNTINKIRISDMRSRKKCADVGFDIGTQHITWLSHPRGSKGWSR